MNVKIRNAAWAALFVMLAGPAAGSAQNYQPDPRNYDQDYPDGYGDSDFRQTVARLSYISGNVAFSRGDEPDEWQPADRNVPMTMGDRVWTASGRLELQIQGGNVVRMAKRTSLVALSLTEDTTQFSLPSGIASFKIGRLDEYDVFEVDTPNAAITFETPGEYRIDVREGSTRIQVRRGQASVASGGGQLPLGAGDAILLEGYDTPRYDFVSLSSDGWDGWVLGREAQFARVRSYEYVSPSIAGVEDLDRYGRWQSLPTYGWSWTPSSVAVGWAPYRAGRWMWQDPWGWTWVSTEQWGWAPYHYGRWVSHQSSWFWVPGQRAAYVPYRPALVAFVGGGPGFSVSVGVGSDYIGWFPLAPREPLIPWWGRPSVNVNVTNITYVNRTYITVVNERTFVGGQPVATNYVRDRAIVNRVERASVLAGPIPIYPTRESLRTSTRSAPAQRPPAAVISRPVVARLAPPPAPPRFAEKSAVIRQNRGAPVNPVEAHRMAEKRDQLKPPVAVRPVAREAGRVELAPKSQTARTVQAQPVTAPRGRQLATREQPVAPEPAPQAERRRQAPAAAPAPDRNIQRTAPTPAGRDREAAQDQEIQQRQQQRDAAEKQQREVQQREAAQQQQQKESQQREVQRQQQQQRETAQKEAQQQQQQQQQEQQQKQSQQREVQRQQQQRETAQAQKEAQQQQLEEQQKQSQQREAQRQQQQRETAQKEAQQQQQKEAQQRQVQQRGPAPTAIPSERVQASPQARERAQPAEKVSPQPRAQRPQNPPAEPEAQPSPKQQRGRTTTPRPTPPPRG